MKSAGDLAKQYLARVLEQKAKQDKAKDQPKTGERP